MRPCRRLTPGAVSRCSRDGARRAVVRVVPGDRGGRQGYGAAEVEDAPVGGRVAGHLAVVQGDGPADNGDRAGHGHAVGHAAPSLPALLLFTWLLLSVKMAEPTAPEALGVDDPAPEVTRSVPAVVLPFTSDLLRVIVPWFTISASLVQVVVL